MELLERFARGEIDAFETLFRQFQGEVYKWILRIVRDPGVAEDLAVETFWRIHRAHPRFSPAGNFGAWARRIATNLALDHCKTARIEVEPTESQLRTDLPDPAVRRDVRDRIMRAFGKLPLKLRVVATLALIEERPYEEIAEALGIPVGTVKSREFRAVRILRTNLKRLGVEP